MQDATMSELIDDPTARADAGAEAMTQAALARLAEVGPQINAFISVRAEEALAQAREIDARRARGERLGELAGLPIAIKDNIDVAGAPATAGSSFFADRVADADAEVVRRLRAADAVVIGKTGLHEFAYGVTSNNPHYGPVRNPWDTTRIPGGSSGGSGAALGADICVLALGTDTGGSVRIPAALNGISGLRPTYGSVSTRGTVPVCASLDTVGAMARSMSDVAMLHRAISGYDRADPWALQSPYGPPPAWPQEGLAGLRVALASGFFAEELQGDVARCVRAAAEQFAALGAEVSERDFPGAQEAVAVTNKIVLAGALSVHAERLEQHAEGFGEAVRRRLELGREVSGVEVMRAIAMMRSWHARMLEHFEHVDLILLPSTLTTAPPIEGSDMITATALLTRFTYPWSLAWLPAGSIPCGYDEQGLPIGLQMVAAPWRDELILHAGEAYQRATDWHRRRPPLGAGAQAASR